MQAKAGPSQSSATGEKKATAAPKQEIVDRILTVDIKTMRINKSDETNFNNPHTLLEVYGKLHRNFQTKSNGKHKTLMHFHFFQLKYIKFRRCHKIPTCVNTN